MITVSRKGAQESQDDFKGTRQVCSKETVNGFSAVGYCFGRVLHPALDIPIGLINDSYGGSACEAQVSCGLLESDPQYKFLIDRWKGIEKILRTNG